MAASKTLATKLHITVWFLTLSLLDSEQALGRSQLTTGVPPKERDTRGLATVMCSTHSVDRYRGLSRKIERRRLHFDDSV